jgi:hypothetical protein
MEIKFKDELRKLYDEFEGIPEDEIKKAMRNRKVIYALYVFTFNIDLKTNVYMKRPEWYIFKSKEDCRNALIQLHAVTKLCYDKVDLYRTNIIEHGVISVAEMGTQRSEKLYTVRMLTDTDL